MYTTLFHCQHFISLPFVQYILFHSQHFISLPFVLLCNTFYFIPNILFHCLLRNTFYFIPNILFHCLLRNTFYFIPNILFHCLLRNTFYFFSFVVFASATCYSCLFYNEQNSKLPVWGVKLRRNTPSAFLVPWPGLGRGSERRVEKFGYIVCFANVKNILIIINQRH